MFSRNSRPSRKGKYKGEMFKSAMLTGTLESTDDRSISSTVHENGAIKIVGQHIIYSVAFLVDGKHIVSGGAEGKIRRWRREDGKEVEGPIDAKSEVNNIAVSRDGKWIVSGTHSGELTVWDAESDKLVRRWDGHGRWVVAVDVSADGKRIATGSGDSTACVWSLSTGQRLLAPLQHDNTVNAAKFSPDGCLIATATWLRDSVRVYDSQNGSLLVDVPIRVNSWSNQSLVWVCNSKNLFALSLDGKINYLDVSTGTTLSPWPIHGGKPGCIALASNGAFIAASAGPSVSLWDTTTHKQIGPIIHHTDDVMSMAISANYDLVIGGGKAITMQNICDVLLSSHHEEVSALARRAGFVPNDKPQQMLREQGIQRVKAEKAVLEETVQSLRVREESSSACISILTCALLALMFIRQQNRKSRERRPATP